MTRPNDFIVNTDYLALAQTSSEDFTATFGPEEYPGGDTVTRTLDFKVKSVPGSVDRVFISYNGGDFTVGPSHEVVLRGDEISTLGYMRFWVYRVDPSTMRVRLIIKDAQPHSIPAQTIHVKVDSFRPPNIF